MQASIFVGGLGLILSVLSLMSVIPWKEAAIDFLTIGGSYAIAQFIKGIL